MCGESSKNENEKMDEFGKRLGRIDIQQLQGYLNGLRAPCYESELFKIAFPEVDITRAHPLTLYQDHFLLFHVLYQLQDDFVQDKKYLFIHFMRTVVVSYPEQGKCRFFDEHRVLFCNAACAAGKEYCALHLRQIGETALEELSLKYFYADKTNFYSLNEETAVAFINGTWEILTHYDTYQNCFQVLGIPETSDIPLIKKAFKRLARQYHPDRGAQSHEKFSEINNAYQFLLRVIPRLKSGQKT